MMLASGPCFARVCNVYNVTLAVVTAIVAVNAPVLSTEAEGWGDMIWVFIGAMETSMLSK